MEVQTLYNPAVLDIPELKEVIGRWNKLEIWHEALRMQMAVGAAAIIAGTDTDQAIESLAVVTLPQAFTDTLPWVVHFHNDGSRALSIATMKGVLDFVRQAGYNGFKALNSSGMPDKKWLKVFKPAGKQIFLGSAYIFDISEGNSNGVHTSGGGSVRAGKLDIRETRKRRGRRPKRDAKVNESAAKRARRSNAAVVPATRTRARRAAR